MRRFAPFLLIALAACSQSRPSFEAPDAGLPDAFPNHNAAQIGARVAEGTVGLTGFYAEGDIALTSPQQNGRFGMKLTAARDGRLYLTIHPGFGIEAARILVRPDSFFVYNRIDKTLRLGSMDEAQAALPVPVTAEEGFATVTGTLAAPPPGWTLRADSLLYHFTSPDGRSIVTVDPAVWRVVRSVRYDAGGALEEERRYERFAQVGDRVFPRRITIHRPGDRIQATLLYREITPNPSSQPPARIEVGAGVRRIPTDG